MGRPRKLTVAPGEEVDVSEEEFRTVREEWNEYELLDGGRVQVKITPLRIYRLLDANGKPAFNADGDPAVYVNSQTLVKASE